MRLTKQSGTGGMSDPSSPPATLQYPTPVSPRLGRCVVAAALGHGVVLAILLAVGVRGDVAGESVLKVRLVSVTPEPATARPLPSSPAHVERTEKKPIVQPLVPPAPETAIRPAGAEGADGGGKRGSGLAPEPPQGVLPAVEWEESRPASVPSVPAAPMAQEPFGHAAPVSQLSSSAEGGLTAARGGTPLVGGGTGGLFLVSTAVPAGGAGSGSGAGRGVGSGGSGGGGITGEGPGAGPAGVGPGEGGGARSVGLPDLVAEIRRRIEAAKRYPEEARRDGIHGAVSVRFRVGTDGKVERVEVVRSSGSRTLDDASVDTIRKAAPYPQVRGWIQVPIAYSLSEWDR